MIHTWGAADGNNPTDNINPYDFYYMFLAGADRKIGVLSGSLKAYWNNLNVEVIVVPEHTVNRLPFGEEDFPIQFPFEPDEYIDIENQYEFGARLQGTYNWGDASLSYFNGYDRGFSLLALKPTDMLMIPFIPQFGYRKTDMLGADFVTFVGDFTLRSELGYFNTENIYENNFDMIFDVDADYLQYVFQLEYLGFSDINLGVQLLGTNVLSAEGTTFNGQAPIPLTKDNFTPGMGTPFAMIAEKADLTMVLTNKKGKTRSSTIRSISKDESKKQIIWFLAPADDKGVSFLKIEHYGEDDEMRLWLPAFNKVRRISSKQKADSFMGSDMSYEDMTSRELDEYTYNLKGSEKIDGMDYFILESVPDPELDSEYSKHISWVSKTDYLVMKEESYDRSDRILKIKLIKYMKLKGYDVPQDMYVENVQKHHNTRLTFNNLELDTNVKDNLFQEKNLKRLPR